MESSRVYLFFSKQTMHKIYIWMNISLHSRLAFFQASAYWDYDPFQESCFNRVSPDFWYAFLFESMLSKRCGFFVRDYFGKAFRSGGNVCRLVVALDAWECE